MKNRQRSRAENVARCLRKQGVLKFIRMEREMVNHIESYFAVEQIVESKALSKSQMLKIEFDFIKLDLLRGKINFLEFNQKLKALVDTINEEHAVKKNAGSLVTHK